MIHSYKQNGYNIILDVFSGSVHVVDSLAYDIINMYESSTDPEITEAMLKKYSTSPDVNEAEIKECLSDIRGLISEGKLFSKDRFEGLEQSFKTVKPSVKALCLHVAHSCNLSCEYCFAGQGKYHGDSALMSLETAKKAVDFLIENSGEKRNLDIDFFGGEPLLNFEVVKDTVAYARSLEKSSGKAFRFTLTTNGLLLTDEVTDFLNREVHNVVLSLDGRKEVHDRLRKAPNGKGSYELAVPNFQRFVKQRGSREYYVRGTYTHYNTDFTEDIFHMVDLGFRRISMEPVVCPPQSPYALTAADLPKLKRQYELLAEYMIKRRREGDPIIFYHYMLDLTGGPCIYKRVAGCGSGTEYLAVTPQGELYPCHQLVGEREFLMGSLDDGITKPEISESFRKCSSYSRAECRSCWARLFCSGGCAANAYHAVGDINGVYEYGCELFRKRMECAIMLKAAEAHDRSVT